MTGCVPVEAHSTAKNVDTHCGLFSARIVFGIPYGTTHCSHTSMTTSDAAAFDADTALVSLLYRCVIIMTNKFFCMELVRRPKISIAINSSGSLGWNS